MPYTYDEAEKVLNAIGMTISEQNCEYRVNHREPNDREATAYYTSDLDDAVDTGVEMRLELTTRQRAA